jgi:uncharacterized membrane protein
MKNRPERKPDLTTRKEPVRLVALSDGLFATVLTLLVLDLRLPEALTAQSGDMAVFLKWIGPHLFSYLLTFFVAGVYWLAHHRDFDYVVHYDRTLLGYNLLFLLFVGLFPFSTAAVGLVDFKSGAYPFYWAIYCANIILAGIMLTVTWVYAVNHGQVDPGTSSVQSRYIIVRQLVTPAVFLFSAVAEYLFSRGFVGPYVLLTIPLVQWLIDRFFAPPEGDGQAAHPGWTERLWRAGPTLLWLAIIFFGVWVSTL